MSATFSKSIWFFFLIVVAFTVVVHGRTDQGSIGVRPVPPQVFSGGDVGFRMTGMKGSTPVGVLVVRVGGEWVKADWSTGVSLAGQ